MVVIFIVKRDNISIFMLSVGKFAIQREQNSYLPAILRHSVSNKKTESQWKWIYGMYVAQTLTYHICNNDNNIHQNVGSILSQAIYFRRKAIFINQIVIICKKWQH